MTPDIAVLPSPELTPLVQVGDLGYAKLESFQVTGSVKYRLVYSRLSQALKRGEIDRHSTLVEASAGSTGLALAYAGKLLGIPVEIHTYFSNSPKIGKINNLGARLILYDSSMPFPEILSSIRQSVEIGGYWHLGQYSRENLLPSYEAFSREIVMQCDKKGWRPKVLLCPVGTGGLVQGVGVCLKKHYPGIRILAFEPARGLRLDGMRNADEVSLGEMDPYDRDFPDERCFLSPEEAGVECEIKNMGLGSAAIRKHGLRENIREALLIAAD